MKEHCVIKATLIFNDVQPPNIDGDDDDDVPIDEEEKVDKSKSKFYDEQQHNNADASQIVFGKTEGI